MTAQAQPRQDLADPRLHDPGEFWCSGCVDLSLFERPPVDQTGMAGGEWSCTACGAAYMDGIDRVVEMVDVQSSAT